MSTEEPGWGGYTEPTRGNGGGGSNPPTPPPTPQPNQYGELPGGATVSEGSDPGDNYGYSSGGNDLSGGSHTSYDNAGNPTTIYTDRLGNVHSIQDYSGRGGGRYDTVIGGFNEGYAGSGYRRSAYTELQQPGVRTAVLAAANAGPETAQGLERAGIIEIQRSQQGPTENYPGNKRWFNPAENYSENNGPRFETPWSGRYSELNPLNDFHPQFKAFPRPPLAQQPVKIQQPPGYKFNVVNDLYTLPIIEAGSKVSEWGQTHFNEIIGYNPATSGPVTKFVSGASGLIFSLPESFTKGLGVVETFIREPVFAAKSTPAALTMFTTSTVEQAKEYPWETAGQITGMVALAKIGGRGNVKGAKPTAGVDVATDAASIKITGAKPEFPGQGSGIVSEHPLTSAESQIRTVSASNFVGPTLKDPLVDISNKGIVNVQDIIGKTEGVKKNSFNEEIYMSMKEPDPKPIYNNPSQGDIAIGVEPEIIGYEPLPPEGNIKVEIAGGKVEANRLIDNIASGLKASGDNIKVKGSEIFSDNGLYGKEHKVVEIDYFNKFKEETLGPKKFRQPEINNLETKDITAMPFENVNLNVGDIQPVKTGLESLKQVAKPTLEGLKQVERPGLKSLKPSVKRPAKVGELYKVKELMGFEKDARIEVIDGEPIRSSYTGKVKPKFKTSYKVLQEDPDVISLENQKFNVDFTRITETGNREFIEKGTGKFAFKKGNLIEGENFARELPGRNDQLYEGSDAFTNSLETDPILSDLAGGMHRSSPRITKVKSADIGVLEPTKLELLWGEKPQGSNLLGGEITGENFIKETVRMNLRKEPDVITLKQEPKRLNAVGIESAGFGPEVKGHAINIGRNIEKNIPKGVQDMILDEYGDLRIGMQVKYAPEAMNEISRTSRQKVQVMDRRPVVLPGLKNIVDAPIIVAARKANTLEKISYDLANTKLERSVGFPMKRQSGREKGDINSKLEYEQIPSGKISLAPITTNNITPNTSPADKTIHKVTPGRAPEPGPGTIGRRIQKEMQEIRYTPAPKVKPATQQKIQIPNPRTIKTTFKFPKQPQNTQKDDLHNIQKAIKKSFRTVRIAPIMEPIAFGQKGRGKSRRRR